MITYQCPHCGEELNIDERYAGQEGKCKKCGGTISVPLPGSSLETQTVGREPRLRTLFWLLAIFFPPGAIVWAFTLPKTEPQKKEGLIVPSVWLAFFLLVGLYPAGQRQAAEERERTGLVEELTTAVEELSFMKTNVPAQSRAGRPAGREESSPPTIFEMGRDATYKSVTLHVYSAQQWVDSGVLQTVPSPGHIFVAVDLSLKNNGAEKVNCNPLYFEILDSSGRQYSNASMARAEPPFPTRKLLKGESARGWVTLEIPANLPSATLLYEMNSFRGDYIRVKLW